LQSTAKVLIKIECSVLMGCDAASPGKCFAFRRNLSLTSRKGTEQFFVGRQPLKTKWHMASKRR